MPKFTFAKQPRETGLASIARPYSDTDIKVNRKKVGYISAPSRFGHDDHLWHILFAVEDGEKWRWTRLKAKFATEPEAREFLTAKADQIIGVFKLVEVDC